MAHYGVLPSVVILLAMGVFVVILFKKLNLSPVLGYLVVGALIGDHGLRIVEIEQIRHIGEYGVVFLLFAIGLELSFERLKVMRKYVFGMGLSQVVVTSIIIAGAVTLFSENGKEAILIGGGLALSSTAIVLQVMEEGGHQSTQVGRIALSILILQDFVVVPLLVIIPLLANDNMASLPAAIGFSFVKAAVALALIFVVGITLLRPLFNVILPDQHSKNNELFVSAVLLIVLSAAFATEYMGLSQALGAFVAGVLVAETEFHLKAEESINPFKGLFLGLFFMSVGMTINFSEIYDQALTILIFTIALMIVKSLIITGLCILFGFNKSIAIHSGLLLAQGGEFAFVLFNMGMEDKIIANDVGKALLLMVTFSMALTPLLSMLGERLSNSLDDASEKSPNSIIEHGTRDVSHHVIIGGFGRVGKMVARIMEAQGVNYVAVDINTEIVRSGESDGFPIFKGDVSQLQTLQALGVDRAVSIIIATENQITLKKALKTISSNYANLPIVVRAPNLRFSAELYDLGATIVVPEDCETGLQLGGAVLKAINFSENEIARVKNQFRAGNYIMAKHDEDMLDEYEDRG